MVKIAEVVVELYAEGFSHSGKQTKGRVLFDLHTAAFTIQVDDEVRNLSAPTEDFYSEEDAKAALLDYWRQCEEELKKAGMPCWKP
jgi:hypothetical protein